MRKHRAPENLFDTTHVEAQEIVEGFLGNKLKSKPSKKTITNSQWERARSYVAQSLVDGVWDDAKPVNFVALYELLHERVYGVLPTELGPTERLHASGAAGRLLVREFNGDVTQFAAFMRWAWMREAEREKWRKDHNRDGGRLGWKLMFNGSLLTDFRIHLKRKRG